MVARLTATCEPQVNDMLSGDPALPGRSALKQMGDTNDPVEIFDGEEKAVTATIMATAMVTDRAAEGEAGDDAKVNIRAAPAVRCDPASTGSARRPSSTRRPDAPEGR